MCNYKSDKIILNFEHPITNEKSFLEIYNGERDRFALNRLKPFNTQAELITIINETFDELDCSKLVSGMPLIIISSQRYKNALSDIYYYINKLENNLIYNEFITKIIETHKNNIIIEAARYNTIKKPETKKSKSKARPNKFVRQVTKDMFTGQIIYVYTNLKTGETIKSTDGNKLDELNAKKKVKREKSAGVPMSAMTFKF